MNVLVVGVGSIGERHVKNLIALGQKVSVFDMDASRAGEVARKYALVAFSSLEGNLAAFELVLVCTPTHTHVEVARKALLAGCNVFIEKPVAEKSSADLTELLALAEKSPRITLVGCNMRFHRGIQQVKKMVDSGMLGAVYGFRAHFGHYLPNWRKTDYKSTYSARSGEGGGILLECIHEFDYLLWLFGEVAAVSARTSRSGALEIDGEDSAEAVLQFKNGILGHLHADCLQQTKRRGCEIIGEKGTIIWESRGKNPEIAEITIMHKNDDPTEKNLFVVDLDEMYLAEMRYFLEMVQRGQKTMNEVANAAETLRVVEMAKQSAGK